MFVKAFNLAMSFQMTFANTSLVENHAKKNRSQNKL